MASEAPIESFGELVGRFPGIDESDPKALGRLAFYATGGVESERLDSALFRLETGEEQLPWHGPVQQVLEDVDRWLSWEHEEVSRGALVSRIIRTQREERDRGTFLASLQEASADQGYALVLDYLQEHGYHIQTEIGSSPLFPEGRVTHTSIEEAKDPKTGTLVMSHKAMLVGKDDGVLHEEIDGYLDAEYPRKKAAEKVADVVAAIEPLDVAKFKEQCTLYGAKAASLMSFNERVTPLTEALKETGETVSFDVPPFFTAGVDVYERWLEDPSALHEISESLRADALDLKKDRLGAHQASLVVVRSSAVKSEDGEEHTGAGIYKSVAVDPNDSEAFRQAIEEVYESTRSPGALSYQESIGVTDEKMGLIIQHYEEGSGFWGRRELFYGHANGSGANPNVLEIHTNAGTLLYDKPAVEGTLMLGAREMWAEDVLHTNPDHSSPVQDAISPTAPVPHAVILAERIFGKPMQVEFVNSSIVQVRPLILDTPETTVSFPEDLEALAETAATGVGDMELQKLDNYRNNSDEKGFVVFWREYEFTLADGHAGYNALPKEGAVIVLNPSHSGHIQALCREKGLMCFYPKKGSRIDHIEAAIDSGENNHEQRAEPQAVTLRFVSDGYDGRIYGA